MAYELRRFSACLLTFGQESELADRFCSHWQRTSSQVNELRVGMNMCRGGLQPAIAALSPQPLLFAAELNLGKPPMMRRMFHERPIKTEWTIWFDDDSFPYRADWLQCLEVAIAAQPDAVLLGVPAVTHVQEQMEEFIREAPWYQGIPLLPTDHPGCAARIEFILGGFWAIKTEWIYKLDWPDSRIVHFEDDYLLGEAIRQNGGKLGRFHSGVKVDTEPRRAPPDMPSTLDVWQTKAN